MLSGSSFKRLVITSFSVLFCAALALVSPGRTSATTLPVVHKSGTLSADETWSVGSVYMVDSTVTVPSGITLTIDHGAIVKYASLFSGSITVAGGMLDVTGTGADPVTFTSANDDTVGGDSTSNGPTSGSVGDYNSAIYLNNNYSGGSTNISHSVFAYAVQGITTSNTGSGSITVSDSTFTGIQQQAIYDVAGDLSLARNTFDLSGGTSGIEAIYAPGTTDLSSIILSGSDTNMFMSSRLNGTAVHIGGTVPSGETWSVSESSGAILVPANISVQGTMNLPSGVVHMTAPIGVQTGGTVNVPAGAILKLLANHYSQAFQVSGGATLNVNGASGNPVVFTSDEDDSVGGDTTGDGSSSGSVGDYGSAIYLNNSFGSSTANVSYAVFMYANQGISPSNTGSGSLTVSDSDFSHISNQAIYQIGALSLARNTFDLSDGTGLDAVEDPYVADLSTIILSGSDENMFTSTRTSGNALYVSGVVPSSATWNISSTSGAQFEPNNIDVQGVLTLSGGVTYSPNLGVGITVENDATLIIPAGAIFKIQANIYTNPTGIRVNSGGTLSTTGTSGSPVIFTSSKDDSLDGDTNGDGTSAGASGDYGYAINNQGGTINASHVNVSYATTAVLANGGDVNLDGVSVDHSTYGVNDQSGLVAFRGSFTDIGEKAVVACNWGTSNCSVDAAYTDWGSSVNPFLSGANLICGQVMATPWVHGGTSYNDSDYIFESPNCNSADTLKASLSSTATSLDDYLTELGVDCGTIQAACDTANRVYSCIEDVTTTAQNALTVSLPAYTPAESVVDYTGDALGTIGDALSTGREETVGNVTSGLSDLIDVIPILTQLNSDYNSCLSA